MKNSIDFNGRNYNGSVYIDGQKKTLQEADPELREWIFEQIQIASGLFADSEARRKIAEGKWSSAPLGEVKDLIETIDIGLFLDGIISPSQLWASIRRKYNLN